MTSVRRNFRQHIESTTPEPNARTRGTGGLARRPAIVPIAATGLAWGVLVFQKLAGSGPSSWNAVNGTTEQVPGMQGGHGGVFSPAGFAMVSLMTVAMMAPLAIPVVRAVADASAWQRTGRAILLFFGAFVATWTVFAVCLAPVAEMLGGVLGSPTRAAGFLALACTFAQFDPRRTVLGRACEPPTQLLSGPDANVDCARFGLLTASRGLRLCALPMLAMLAVPSSLLVMALLTALAVIDRFTQGSRRVPIAAGYLLLAAGLLVIA